MPLYLYSGDKKAGDANGEGVGGVQWLGGTWHAISPSGRIDRHECDPTRSGTRDAHRNPPGMLGDPGGTGVA